MGFVLFTLLFIIISVTVGDLILETVRASVTALIYKFKYLYLYSILNNYLDQIRFSVNSLHIKSSLCNYVFYRILLLPISQPMKLLSFLFVQDAPVIVANRLGHVRFALLEAEVRVRPITIFLLCYNLRS